VTQFPKFCEQDKVAPVGGPGYNSSGIIGHTRLWMGKRGLLDDTS
jgi:hypothetical protein